MPANLTPVYKEAEAKFRSAVTPEEKIACLEEMLRVIPKHKGTDKLQADLRSRLSRLKREPKKKGATKGFSHKVPTEGAGQVVLLGPPNAGKSSLVATLTHAKPEVASYPMTTRDTSPGMMPYEDIAIQLVDMPPLCEEHVEPWVYDVARGGDMAWLVVSIERPIGDGGVRVIGGAADDGVDARMIEALPPVNVVLGLGKHLRRFREGPLDSPPCAPRPDRGRSRAAASGRSDRDPTAGRGRGTRGMGR